MTLTKMKAKFGIFYENLMSSLVVTGLTKVAQLFKDKQLVIKKPTGATTFWGSFVEKKRLQNLKTKAMAGF